MLERLTREKFKNNNWSEIVGNESNPHQFVNRIAVRIDSALEDLAIIAKRLPDKEFEKVFTVEKLGGFIDSLTRFEDRPSSKSIRRPLNHKIRLLLIESGLAELKDMTEKEYAYVPNLSRLVSTKIEETYSICKDLLADIERKDLEREALIEGRLFLFKFSDLNRYENFQPLLETILLTIYIQNLNKKINNYIAVVDGQFNSPNHYTAKIVDTISQEELGNCSLLIKAPSTCELKIKLGEHMMIENLIYENRNNDYLIYRLNFHKLGYDLRNILKEIGLGTSLPVSNKFKSNFKPNRDIDDIK
ncbi:MAG TPA: hypothetical protein VFG45_04310 [Candidatus Nitrosocosmicus sp.]|nr:hypothetical protein [Candidatus Nitrosocosmicus sp.]